MNMKRFLSDQYRRQIDHKINKLVINHQINQKHSNRPQTTQAKKRCVSSILSPLPSLANQNSNQNPKQNSNKKNKQPTTKNSNPITFESASEIYKMKCLDLKLKPNPTAEKRFVEQFMNSVFPKSMRLSGLGLGPTCITHICKILLKNPQFVYLDLQMNRLKEEGAAILKKYLQLNPPIIFLNLKSNSIGATGTSSLFKSLEGNIHLTSLDLGAVDGIDRNRLGTPGCKAVGNMLLRNQTLANLNLSMCGITAEGCPYIGQALTQNDSLFSLDLTANRFGSLGAKGLFKEDGSFGGLETLILSRNAIGNDASSLICRQMQLSKSIRSLDLSNNEFSKPFLENLHSAFQEGTKVSRLSLSKNKFGPECAEYLHLIIRDFPLLTYLDLSKNNLKDEGLIPIAQSLKQNTTMNSIDLSETGMTDKSGIEFAQVISTHPSLQKLYLSENALSDVSGIEIANALCQNITLVVLSLSNNELRDDSAYAFLNALNINSTIADLNVDYNDFGPNAYVDLSKKIEEHKRILNSNVAGLALKRIDWLKEEEGRLFQYNDDIKEMQKEITSAIDEFATKEGELHELCLVKEQEIDEMNEQYVEIRKKHDDLVSIRNDKTREHRHNIQLLEKQKFEASAQLKNLSTQRQILMVNRNRKKDALNQLKADQEKEINELNKKKEEIQNKIKDAVYQILRQKKEMIDQEDKEKRGDKKESLKKKKKKTNSKKKNSSPGVENQSEKHDEFIETSDLNQSAASINNSNLGDKSENSLQSTSDVSFQDQTNVFVSQSTDDTEMRPKRPKPDDQRISGESSENLNNK